MHLLTPLTQLNSTLVLAARTKNDAQIGALMRLTPKQNSSDNKTNLGGLGSEAATTSHLADTGCKAAMLTGKHTDDHVSQRARCWQVCDKHDGILDTPKNPCMM